jgi:hypothetical protein
VERCGWVLICIKRLFLGLSEGHFIMPCRTGKREVSDYMLWNSQGLQNISTWEKTFQATGTNTLLKIICEFFISFAYFHSAKDLVVLTVASEGSSISSPLVPAEVPVTSSWESVSLLETPVLPLWPSLKF